MQAQTLSSTEFARLCSEMVAEEMPWMFAVVQEQGEREDGWIAGWGLMFRDRVDVVALDGRGWVRVDTPAEAERLFDHDDRTGLLIWCGAETE